MRAVTKGLFCCAFQQMKSLLCPLLLGRFVGLLAWDPLSAGQGCFALSFSGIFHLRGKSWQADTLESFKSLRLNLPGGKSRTSLRHRCLDTCLCGSRLSLAAAP